jgi:Asp-tRNA(Asn)/Glu-tRNA(Gln) amidotransferase A subunit family amidase
MLSAIAGPDPRDRHSLPRADFGWMKSLDADLKGLRVAYSPDWGYATVDARVRRIVDEAVRVFERDLGCSVEIAHPGWSDAFDAFWAIVAMDTDLRGMRAMAAELGQKMSPHLVAFLNHPWTAEDFTNATRKAVVNKMWRFINHYDCLQIVGHHLDDPLVLRASAAFEQARPWRNAGRNCWRMRVSFSKSGSRNVTMKSTDQHLLDEEFEQPFRAPLAWKLPEYMNLYSRLNSEPERRNRTWAIAPATFHTGV